MSKRKIPMLVCAAALVLCMAAPAMAAGNRSAACYYPVEVESYTTGDFDQPRIRKVYQLSVSDDPSGIPTADFEQYGMTFHFLEMTRKAEVGVDTQPLTKTITTDSSTGDLGEILKQLAPEIEVETEDGYSGTLKLDYNSVMAEVQGYKTSTRKLSTTRTFPNLSDADLSLIPKTVTDGGRTLTLADVKWSSATDMEGEDVVVRYTATASYTGSVSSRYATGYTVTANYVGEVAKTNCELVTYTAIFGSTTEADPNSSASPSSEPALEQPDGGDSEEGLEDVTPVVSLVPVDDPQGSEAPNRAGGGVPSALAVAGCIGGVLSLASIGYWGFEKIKERRKVNNETETPS